MHINDGQLRAYLDGELNEPYSRLVRDHLATCPVCQAQLAQLQTRISRVDERLALLSPQPDDSRLAARPALLSFKSQTAMRLGKEKNRMFIRGNIFSNLFTQRWRPLVLGLIALALAVGLFTFPPAHQALSAFLSLFRIHQITILEVDSTRLSDLAGDSPLGKRLGQLLSDTVTVTKEPADPETVGSADEASQKAGFRVRLFKDNPSGAPPRLTVQDNAAFYFAVDLDRAQAILDETGYGHLKLPESIDGATISFDIPKAVSAAYGDCPTRERRDDDDDTDRLPPDAFKNCVILAQTPGPVVNAPPEVDMAPLAEVGLQILGMTPEEARNFSQAVDWTSTLVVPIPRNGAQYKQVQVDGVTGNLIYRRADDGMPERYTILWVKDDLVYALAAIGDPEAGLTLANSLQ